MIYLKGDGPHQTVMILYGCNSSSYIITLHIMNYLCFLAKVSHTTDVLFATLDTIIQVQYDLAITRNTCGSICSLNCLNLFLKIKLVRLVQCVLTQECFTSRVDDVFKCLTCFLVACFGVYFNCIHLVLVFLLEKPCFRLLDRCLIPPP